MRAQARARAFRLRLLAELPRKDCRTIAEHADLTQIVYSAYCKFRLEQGHWAPKEDLRGLRRGECRASSGAVRA